MLRYSLQLSEWHVHRRSSPFNFISNFAQIYQFLNVRTCLGSHVYGRSSVKNWIGYKRQNASTSRVKPPAETGIKAVNDPIDLPPISPACFPRVRSQRRAPKPNSLYAVRASGSYAKGNCDRSPVSTSETPDCLSCSFICQFELHRSRYIRASRFSGRNRNA